MLLTLRLYILGQLLRTFLFAAATLVLLFMLGGGVAAFIGSGDPGLLLIMLPIAATMTSPVALLLATTMVFGRLSADNELDACRAGGVNLFSLLAVPFLLAAMLSSIVAYSTAELIPRYIGQLTGTFTLNVQNLIFQQIRLMNSISFDTYAIYASEISRHPTDASRFELNGVVFLEGTRQNLRRYGSADHAEIQFNTNADGQPTANMLMSNVQMWDTVRREWIRSELQPLGPYILPTPKTSGLKWLPVSRLLTIRENPHLHDANRRALERVSHAVSLVQLVRSINHRLARGETVIFHGGEGSARLTAASAVMGGGDEIITLEQCELLLSDQRRITAPRGDIRAEPAPLGDQWHWRISLRARPEAPVILYDPAMVGQAAQTGLRRDRESRLFNINPDDLAQTVDDDVIRRASAGEFAARAAEHAEDYRGERIFTDRSIDAEVHYRLAFSLSTIILVPLGAMLGIAFRGAHVLTAFALSGAPGLLVLVTVLLGRNYITRSQVPGDLFGIAIVWLGNLICLAILLVVAGRVLRR